MEKKTFFDRAKLFHRINSTRMEKQKLHGLEELGPSERHQRPIWIDKEDNPSERHQGPMWIDEEADPSERHPLPMGRTSYVEDVGIDEDDDGDEFPSVRGARLPARDVASKHSTRIPQPAARTAEAVGAPSRNTLGLPVVLVGLVGLAGLLMALGVWLHKTRRAQRLLHPGGVM